MKIKSRLLSALTAAILFTGCATLSDPNSLTISAIKVAANVGAFETMKYYPETRPDFQAAYDQLGVLLEVGSMSLDQLKAILTLLPVKELSSDDARLIISNAELLFDDYVRKYTRLEKVAPIPVVGQAIYDGLGKALSITQAELNAQRTAEFSMLTIRLN